MGARKRASVTGARCTRLTEKALCINHGPMIVMKFGGSSLADGPQVLKVLEIVRARRAQRPVVVCSAHKGITDALIAAARAAAAGQPDVAPVADRQREVIRQLGGDTAALDPFFDELSDLLRGISLVREVSPRVLDYVQSFGERMSVRTVAEAFTNQGLPARAHDAFDVGFVTDEVFGTARPLEDYEARVQAAFQALPEDVVPVITGFVGKTTQGEITTVGRNGSDFSAACFAAALGAEECQIWTDTDGVMTSDPRLIPAARNIPKMSFAEAAELAYYGGRVLHPSTLVPAVRSNIPVRVLNTNRPEHQGTVITEVGDPSGDRITSIAYKENQSVLTLESPKMLGQPGFLAKIFEVLGRHQVDVDMISTSEVSVSMTIEATPGLTAAHRELEDHGTVSVAHGKSLVCVVGRDLKAQHSLAGRVFGALGQAEVPVEMISFGANAINLSFLVADDDVKRAVPALHAVLFEA